MEGLQTSQGFPGPKEVLLARFKNYYGKGGNQPPNRSQPPFHVRCSKCSLARWMMREEGGRGAVHLQIRKQLAGRPSPLGSGPPLRPISDRSPAPVPAPFPRCNQTADRSPRDLYVSGCARGEAPAPLPPRDWPFPVPLRRAVGGDLASDW